MPIDSPPDQPRRRTAPGSPERAAADRRYRLLVALGLAAVIVMLGVAIHMTNTGPDQDGTVAGGGSPGVVEQFIPANGTQALRQSEIGIDLAAGYDASLSINGIAIPRKQMRIVPAQNQLFFTPGPGKVIEKLDAGKVLVTASVWKVSVGSGPQDQTYGWSFSVT